MPTPSRMFPEAAGLERIGRALRPGETVIWSGRPGQGFLLTGRDALLIPFSLMWGGFAVFWEVQVSRTNAPFFFRLWGVPFVLIGLYFLVGRSLVDAWVRGRTQYAVTNGRILISRSGPFPSLTALSRAQLPQMQVSEFPDGPGTIRFGLQLSTRAGRGSVVWSPSLDPTPQFIAIENARDVFDLIQDPKAIGGQSKP